MMRLTAWLGAFTAVILLWHECSEDIVVFCYRIGSGVFATARSRALVPVPVSPLRGPTPLVRIHLSSPPQDL